MMYIVNKKQLPELLVTTRLFCSPFPTVAEAVQEELEDYKTKEDEVRRLKRAMVTILIRLVLEFGF